MGNRKINIETINQKSITDKFWNNFMDSLDLRIRDSINEILKQSDVYLFSGIIRDFFLKEIDHVENDNRDIDLVLSNCVENIEEIFSYASKISKNSFGGYKIENDIINIDLWCIDETWTFKKRGYLNLDLSSIIHKTAFFNFSSIVFNFQTKEFIADDHFLNFINKKKIDIVNKLNPNPALCIVNTIYYFERLNFKYKVGGNLKEWIFNNIDQIKPEKFEEVQTKHFGQIKYDYSRIKKFSDELLTS